ncbi:uncharacterized protein PHALS_14800 [Plasmopara halstedii]|uniref:Uncharacterized protein n=1 Tax=Plasmopara halstedii TaxID=4781 RepID=A0A0P1AVW3_PLAHL|nr:uncharacterized protein PHALS_14800 [Plasmopara halstedii]CEG45288.1 hypothetical protein PHALS_14800 [Plasmopara halstedii]|eukprot:XP_024581657.1 hypothetical protein PHALS_14800 [Plasmopara halstedii]
MEYNHPLINMPHKHICKGICHCRMSDEDYEKMVNKGLDDCCASLKQSSNSKKPHESALRYMFLANERENDLAFGAYVCGLNLDFGNSM